MIWALLALVGVPLWLCAIAILVLVLRNRAWRRRAGDIPVCLLRPGKARWVRGHAIWISDVLAWRGSPAAWDEALEPVTSLTLRLPTDEERRRLRHLGDDLVVATLTTTAGSELEVASSAEHRQDLAGPFLAAAPGLERR